MRARARLGPGSVPREAWLALARRLTPPRLFSAEVDVEGVGFGTGELDSVGSGSDVDDHYSLRGGCSHGSYGPPCRRPGRPGLS